MHLLSAVAISRCVSVMVLSIAADTLAAAAAAAVDKQAVTVLDVLLRTRLSLPG